MSYRILIVDDETDILEFVSYNLKKEGFEVYTAQNGLEAIDKAMEVVPHLILLDVMMPEMDGIRTCEQLRKRPQLEQTLVAFLSARGDEETQLDGFEAGGDNYIAKPIHVKVLVSRVKAMLKRIDQDREQTSDDGERSIQIDRDSFTVTRNGEQILLPRKEFNLLSLLYSRPGKVFSREDIYSLVWGNDVVVGDRTIDVHIRKLRAKIGEEHIITIKGVGYKYAD